jgi:hypothetical protein
MNLILLLIIIVVVLWLIFSQPREYFDASTTVFVPEGYQRYGLRGEPLRTVDISNYFIRPDRRIRLHHTSNWMYPSNRTPRQVGIPFCRRVNCTTNTDEYDAIDRCYTCGDYDGYGSNDCR